MSQPLGVATAVLLGAGVALQVALIGAMGRARGPLEATWVSLFATVTGVAAILTGRALAGASIRLPGQLTGPWPFAVIAAGALAVVLYSVTGLPRYYALTGLLAVPFLTGGAFLAPRLGLGLYLGGTIAGQLILATVLDRAGAFGAVPIAVTPARLAGVALLLAGVLLLRR